MERLSVNCIKIFYHPPIIPSTKPQLLASPIAKALLAILILGLSLPAMAACEDVDEDTVHALKRQFDEVDYCQVNHLITAKQKDKWGYINEEGEVKIPFIYEGAERFADNGLAWVKLDQKFGMIDTTGQVITPMRFDMASENQGGRVTVRQGNQIGYLDDKGNIAIPLEYSYGADFEDGYAVVGKTDATGDAHYGIIDKNNRVVVPLINDFVADFSDGLSSVGIKVGNGMQYGYINQAGKLITPMTYDDAYDMVDGFAAVMKDKKWGYINKQGKVAIPLQYDDVWDFIQGTAVVKKADKYGVINQKNRLIIPFEYDLITHGDEDNTFDVEKDGESYVINQKNQRIKLQDDNEASDAYY